MFCPKCGSNQGETKRFCTMCGTNLAAVSQALTGQIQPPPNYYAPPPPHPIDIQRQRDMAKGVRFSIIGGGIVALKLFSFIFSGFRGSPLGFWTFIGFILLAIGVSKIISSRPPYVPGTPGTTPRESNSINQFNPHPVFSAPAASETVAPQTSELEGVRRQSVSVTEDDTRHLPHSKPHQELPS